MKQARGITLLEMLVVMTLIGLLAAIAAPSVGSGVETVRLRSTSERLAATLRTARTRAMRARHYMQVSVDPKSGVVELRDLEGGSVASSVASWEIPSTIQVQSDQRLAFLVYPDGGAQAMLVTLRNQRGRELEVALDPFTLFPSVREISHEVSQGVSR
jgi:type II secretion system protein H